MRHFLSSIQLSLTLEKKVPLLGMKRRSMAAFAIQVGVSVWGLVRLKSRNGSVMTALSNTVHRVMILVPPLLRQIVGMSLLLEAMEQVQKATFVMLIVVIGEYVTITQGLVVALLDTLARRVRLTLCFLQGTNDSLMCIEIVGLAQ
mmetsp:Transcript_28655/g.33844  ORF Transcript_28655/g.33844 Transcript_28655/m.33844 type:complete len:146 (-) Transcript_28655:80-517(-)